MPMGMQVTKEGLAARVVDKQQIYRSMSKEEMLHLFDFGDEELLEQTKELVASCLDISGEAGPSEQNKSFPRHDSGCSDWIMMNLLDKYQPSWIVNYHEHETLLQENEAERLTKEEQEMAWLNYQRSLESEEVNRTAANQRSFEWEEVSRTTVFEDQAAERKQPTSISTTTAYNNSGWAIERLSYAPQHVKNSRANNSQSHQLMGGSAATSNPKNRVTTQRKCSNLAHLLMLRSCATQSGTSTTCADCGQEISYETLNRDGRAR